MAVDERWARWIYASIAKHLHAVATAKAINLVVELLNERPPAWETASPRAEAHITGPVSKQVSKGCYRMLVNVFITLTTNRGANDYDHIDDAGAWQNALDQCILVMDYGDTGLLTVSELIPERDLDASIPITPIRPSINDAEIHTTITGRFEGLFQES